MLADVLLIISTAYNEMSQFLIRWGKWLKAANYPLPLRQGKRQIIRQFRLPGAPRSCP